MRTIKEEINKIISECRNDKFDACKNVYFVKQVIDVFEKLIDEKLKPLEKEQRNRTTVNEYNSFAIKKLEELKEELKEK